ncbi:L,D-transpeptidase catalytic domain [Pseudooceanicola antarcticus]|uniref:L,D-transpeptidase catalytic domain n=1 Tax=Pseudooceanicola antarcticus TaxID=1247613 RepID=A0A285HNY5_9RHOB|nr:L,D-transpeptidase family protein [Pseudooceanicola antarcticus]PJE27732.1 hypothetical protein CVM39_14235 [Pseudooceanicola antarcticus]SNY37397.1 L,D-transpeptidase catalytic domain [Pseudooceanicola antarcticus]
MKAVLTPQGLRLGQRTYPCSIGRGGLSGTKREGDGATPTGLHRVAELWYRPDRLAKPTPWARPIGPGDLWCDAPDHPDYNLHVRAPFSASHEKLRRADPLYDLVLVLDWNCPDARPGLGSAIFIHQWRRAHYPTEGCLALRRDQLRDIARKLAPGSEVEVPPLSAF